MTTVTTAEDRARAQEVASIINSQIQRGVLMSLGASGLIATIFEGMSALMFDARILPFNKNGERAARPAKMKVFVALGGDDTYTVVAVNKGVDHARKTTVYADDLNAVLLALDFDGAEPFNPRYTH